MKRLKGTGASRGIAIGRLAFFKSMNFLIEPGISHEPEREAQRFITACHMAASMVEDLWQRALLEVGEEDAMIFEFQRMLLSDEGFHESVMGLIQNAGCTAEYAVQQAGAEAMRQFNEIPNDYLRERRTDIQDMVNRLLHLLSGKPTDDSGLGGQFVIACQRLMPSEIIQLDQNMVLAVVCRNGSITSHASILARTMGIPAVVGLGTEQYGQLRQYDTVIIDGFRGELIVEPDERTLAHYRQMRQEYLARKERLKRLRGLPSRTADGVDITISAYIGALGDISSAVDNDAQGIGLFRSDSIYLRGRVHPSEQEQFECYRTVLDQATTRRTWVRALMFMPESEPPHTDEHWEDQLRFGHTPVRGKELYQEQMRALLRAATFGNLALLIPMVRSEEEVESVYALLEECRRALNTQKLNFGTLDVGVLIETPAAVLISDKLAWMADFFLIDTDNLMRTVLAADRHGADSFTYGNVRHPAVMRAIRMVADAAYARNIPCGICGQAAADLELTEEFLSMHIDEFVVAPNEVLPLRERIRATNTERKKTWPVPHPH